MTKSWNIQFRILSSNFCLSIPVFSGGLQVFIQGDDITRLIISVFLGLHIKASIMINMN